LQKPTKVYINIIFKEMAPLKIDIQSEIGTLNAVLLHSPGAEVENMTPKNVQRALYSDILNLSIAQQEYSQLEGVLGKVAKVYKVRELLTKVLSDGRVRPELIRKICLSEGVGNCYDTLMAMPSEELSKVLIEGLPAKINTLTSFMRNEYYALYPLYNFYFTRDSAVTIGNSALVCSMANKVRVRESLIMNAIYRHSGEFDCDVIDASGFQPEGIPAAMEGGDILVAREDILLIGNGVRTSTKGIDFLIDRLRRKHDAGRFHIIVQQLPDSPESFIHLDMVFTFLDKDKCMVFKPLILDDNQYQTVCITVADGNVESIRSVASIPKALKKLGMDLEPITCGGEDEWDQEREQWHSGANFFAFAPGKVLTYARNIHTLDELDRHGFKIMSAEEFIRKADAAGIKQGDDLSAIGADGLCAVTISGSELPRGGGGARCMTMPLSRARLD